MCSPSKPWRTEKELYVVGVVSFLLVFMLDTEESEGIEIVQGKADVSGVKT